LKKECTIPFCSYCNQSGHKRKDCVNEPVCNNCMKPGHMRKNCTEPIKKARGH